MPGGRPSKFKTVDDLEDMIDWYFFDSLYDSCGMPRPIQRHISISGLALYLGFADRQSIQDYNKRDEFSFTIKRARLVIESYLEEKLMGTNVTGVIFNLKNNYGWKDTKDVTVDGSGVQPIINVTTTGN